MRLGTKRPKQPVTWVPEVLELFKQKGRLTSQELAAIAGKTIGGDAVTRCRQLGIPIQAAGTLNGSRPPRKLYVVDVPNLWLALQEAVRQIDRYALLLNDGDNTAEHPIFRTTAAWIQHVRRLQDSQFKCDPEQRA